MSERTLQVFVNSRMEEITAERQAVKVALEQIKANARKPHG